MRHFRKRILSKIYSLNIFVKNFFWTKRKKEVSVFPINDLIEKYSNYKKIVVLCNGPSANNVEIHLDHLYLITNNGIDLMDKGDFLYYVNDGFYIRKILSQNKFTRKEQKLLFYYDNSLLHKEGLKYLMSQVYLLREKKLFFISSELNNPNSKSNFIDFTKFYSDRNLPVKIQNSGIFLLLLGYYLAVKTNLPLEIYGLDLGVGGNLHFNGKGIVGKSVTDDRVKKNVQIYLDFMYKEYNFIKNYSNFWPN